MWGRGGIVAQGNWVEGGGGKQQAMGDLLTKFLDNKAFAVLVKKHFLQTC